MKKPLIDKDGEVREITAEDMKHFKPAKEVLPPEFFIEMDKLKAKRQRGRPKIEAPREMLSLRLKKNVVAGIKSSGKGYNTRVEKILEEALESGKL
jgi:uncharacterized protein (DUF4415 family)